MSHRHHKNKCCEPYNNDCCYNPTPIFGGFGNFGGGFCQDSGSGSWLWIIIIVAVYFCFFNKDKDKDRDRDRDHDRY